MEKPRIQLAERVMSISQILFHPATMIIALIFSMILLRDILKRGSHLFSVQDCVYKHIAAMTKDKGDEAWDELSFDLKTLLTQARREKKGGKDFVGANRVKIFAKQNAKLYKEGRLTIDSVNKVMKVASPKEMYMVRLRSQASGYLRMTVWVSRVPLRADGWSVEEVCVHPEDGNIHLGETLTGNKLKPKASRLQKAIKARAKARAKRATES